LLQDFLLPTAALLLLNSEHHVLFQVKQIRHGKEIKMDLMVMENILFGHNVSRTYDLKGAIFSRYVSDSNDHGTVYLDQNFVDDMRVSPIYIGGRAKHLLERAIWNDTSFLTVCMTSICAAISQFIDRWN
jgi:hypothetical protein